jgi:hypothetical protein
MKINKIVCKLCFIFYSFSMDVVQQLKNVLRCPCCLKKPRPITTSVGMCDNGHTTCEPCGRRLLEQPPALCPVCREPKFKVVRGHYLAVSVLEIVTAVILYSCRHHGCAENMNGSDLVQHEIQCSYKPLACPSINCDYKGPLHVFMDGLHNNCIEVYNRMMGNLWSFPVEISKVYCFDTNFVKISNRFKTILLQGTTVNNFVSRAYMNIILGNNGIIIFTGWMDKKDDVAAKYTKLKIDMFAYINSASGEIGHYSSRPPVFEGEVLNNEDGLHIPCHMLYNWAKWSSQHKCPECQLQSLHFHVRIQFNEPPFNV